MLEVIAASQAEVSVQFKKSDYGYLNESNGDYIRIEVERTGRMETPFIAIVEVFRVSDVIGLQNCTF